MTEYVARRNPNRCPAHPGELLREVIPPTGKSKVEVAALIGISRQHLYDILAERKPVSPTVAVRLGKLFGDGAGVWVRMQGAYDTWHAERELSAEVRKIPTLKTAGEPGRLLRQERTLRNRITNFRASDRLSRDKVHDRRR
jgi:addiction module HigA family antidote